MKILNACPFHLKDDKIRILWEVTPKCNMYCKHCLFFQNTQKGIEKELNTKQMYKIIENIAKDKSVNAIWLSGGEPLLRKDIVDICQKISDYNIKPSISTNGILLNEKLIEKLHNAGVDYIHLSIDGGTAKTHEDLRGVKGSFELLMKAMDMLKESPIKTGASFMVTEDSIDEMEKVIEIAVDKDLRVMSFYLVAELGRGAENFKNQEDGLVYRLQEKMKKIERWRRETNSNLKIEVFRADSCNEDDEYTDENEKNYHEEAVLQECKAEQFLNITYDGKLGGCPWLMKSEQGFDVGSLLEEDFLVLKSRCQNEIKRKNEERKEKMSLCKECSKKQECGRGCPALQINDNKLYYGLDSICPNLHSHFTTKSDSNQIPELV